MKVKITFELDLKGTHYNIPNKSVLNLYLQNLGSWIHALHLKYLDNRIEAQLYKGDPATKKAHIMHAEQDAKLSAQIFNNYTVEGTTENGQHFKFTHQEPGYKEELKVTKP